MRNSIVLLFALTTGTGCSNVRLAKMEQQTLSEVSMSAQYCSKLGRTENQPFKVVFVIDMSMSNIGTYSGSKFDSTAGTDVAEARFAAAERFITDCGAQNAANQYSIIGFSNGIISSKGTESCHAPFLTTANDAKSAIGGLRQIQKDNLTYYSGTPTQMKDMAETDYSKAIDCASTAINTDLAKNGASQPYYHVFFLTDGKPNPDPCYGSASCYREKIELLNVQVTGASSVLKFQPVYYGKETDKTAALRVLNPMAEAGRVDSVLVVDKLSDLKLCDLTSKPVSVRYRKESLTIANVTSKLDHGRLLSDSDMDGIPDEQETALGFDPKKKRTFGALDSICKNLGGPDLCKKMMSQLTCSQKSNNLGMTECDIRAMKLDSTVPHPGIDTDGDGIPDYLELLRDSLPNFDDATSDLDNDGLINRAEINSGSQVNVPDRDVDPVLLMRTHESQARSAPGCSSTQESWILDLEHIPLVRTQEFQETVIRPPTAGDLSYLELSHGTDENVVVISFKSVPENDPKSKVEIWGAVLKIPFESRLQKPSYLIQPSDFHLLGEVSQ